MNRPEPSEYFEYYDRYVSRVPAGDIVEFLADQLDSVMANLGNVDEEQAGFRYEPEKWSIKEVLGHITDVERVFAYRCLAFARGDQSEFPSFEQDDYVAGTDFNSRTLGDLLDEFRLLRASNIVLFRSFNDEEEVRTGTASGYRFTTRAVPYIMAGHVDHHLEILREHYLQDLPEQS